MRQKQRRNATLEMLACEKTIDQVHELAKEKVTLWRSRVTEVEQHLNLQEATPPSYVEKGHDFCDLLFSRRHPQMASDKTFLEI